MWIEPHLFGLEVKQGKAHATPRQLSRLVWLRKHHVHAWIVRSPDEARLIISLTLEGIMTFNDDLLAELDAALLGGSAPVAETATAQPLEELPDFGTNGTTVAEPEVDDEEALRPSLPTVEDMSRVTEALREDTDAMERQADALEALVLEMSRLNANLANLMGRLASAPPEAEPVQTAAAPSPRRRRAIAAPEADQSSSS